MYIYKPACSVQGVPKNMENLRSSLIQAEANIMNISVIIGISKLKFRSFKIDKNVDKWIELLPQTQMV